MTGTVIEDIALENVRRSKVLSHFDELDGYQVFIFCLYLMGWSAPALAREMGCSTQNITYHLRKIKGRLNAASNGNQED
jgi:hypothetical protein